MPLIIVIGSAILNTYIALVFCASCFTFFCISTSCQFTPLLNLHSLVFGYALWLTVHLDSARKV